MKTKSLKQTRLFIALVTILTAVVFTAIFLFYAHTPVIAAADEYVYSLEGAKANNSIIPNGYEDGYLKYELDTVNKTARFEGLKANSDLTKFKTDVADTDPRYGFFKYDTLQIPSTVVYNNESYSVNEIGVGANLGELVSLIDGDWYTNDVVRAIIIPNSVTKIGEHAFRQFPRLEYFVTPFVGTERGTLNDANKPLASMFSPAAPFFIKKNASTDEADAPDSNVPDVEQYTTDVEKYSYVASNYLYERSIQVNMGDLTETKFSNASWINETKNISTIARWYEGDTTGDAYKNAFLLPKNLKYIEITDDTKLPDRALFELNNVRTIKLPDAMTDMDSLNIMAHCYSLTEVVFPKTVSKMGDMCLSQCSSLETVRMPVVNNIPKGTFSRCYALTDVEISSNVGTIHQNAFQNCKSLVNIKTYTYDENYNFTGYASNSNGDGINLPEKLVEIKEEAFVACSSITTISLASQNLKYIQKGAFKNCSGITTITLPFIGKCCDNVENTRGKEESCFGWIFGSGNSITQQYTPDIDENTPGDSASFYLPPNLTTIIINGESYVETGSLSNLVGVNTIEISPSANVIEEGALKGCTTLKDITVPYVGCNISGELIRYNQKILNSSNNKFAIIFGKGATGMTTISRQDNYQVSPLLEAIRILNMPTIKTGAFAGISTVQSVVISDATTEFGSAVFHGNTSLKTLQIPVVGYKAGEEYNYWWWYQTYQRYNSLGYIFSQESSGGEYPLEILRYSYYDSYTRWIPSTLETLVVTNETALGPESIRGFSSLKTVRINNFPGYISCGALSECSGLEEVELPYIGENINVNSYNGTNYTVGWIFGKRNYAGSYAAFQYDDTYYIPNHLRTVKINYDGEHEKGIKVLPDYALANMKSLESFSTEAPLSELRTHVFENDVNLSFVKTPYASYKKVGNYAFYNCEKISYINEIYLNEKNEWERRSVVPLTATIIGDYAFAGTAIPKLNFSDYEEDGVTPLEYKIKEIGKYAFANCTEIEELYIPEVEKNGTTSKLDYLGDGAFSGCTALATVTLGKNAAAPYLFANCTKLQSIDLSNVTTVIPDGIFSGCSSLTNITLDNNTRTIGAYAFSGCESLKSFVIKPTITTIMHNAFNYCTGLEMMKMLSSVKKIEEHVFDGCNREVFHFIVNEPRSEWPSGWVNNWNCDFPVYVNGDVDDSKFDYAYDADLRGYRVTNVVANYYFEGILTIPATHNGVNVVSIANNAFANQTAVTCFVVPETVKRILGTRTVDSQSGTIVDGPFANGRTVTVYIGRSITQSTSPNLGKYYVGNELNPTGENIPSLYGTEAGWMNLGYVYYKDYWNYANKEINIPYLRADQFDYEIDFDNLKPTYSGLVWEPKLKSVRTRAIVVGDSDTEIGLARSLTIPLELFNLSYRDNLNAGTAKIDVTPNQNAISSYNELIDFDNYPICYYEYLSEDASQSNPNYSSALAAKYNPMVASTEKIYISGKGLTTFTIEKKIVTIFPLSTNNFVVNTVYGFNMLNTSYPWACNQWNLTNTDGLYDHGFSMRGTLVTKNVNAGTYVSADANDAVYNNSFGDFKWYESPTVYLGGIDVTSNCRFVLAPLGITTTGETTTHSAKLVVNVDKMNVTVDWTGGFWSHNGSMTADDNYDGENYKNRMAYLKYVNSVAYTGNTDSNNPGGESDFYVWQYEGAAINLSGKANSVAVNNGVSFSDWVLTEDQSILSLTSGSIYFGNSDGYKPDYKSTSLYAGAQHSVTATLKESKMNNYRLMAHTVNDSDEGEWVEVSQIFVPYFITEKEVTITINDGNYLIPYDDEYWQCTNFAPYISGLNEGTIFIGDLRTIDNLAGEKAEHRYSDETIKWEPQKFFDETSHDYYFVKPLTDTPTGNKNVDYEDESSCYKLKVSAYVKIVYNKFDMYYVFETTDTISGNTYIERVNSYIGEDSQHQPIEIIEYETEGLSHTFKVMFENDPAIPNTKYQISYTYKYGVNQEITSSSGYNIKELGSYPVSITVNRHNFEQEGPRNIRIDLVKSYIQFDSLDKEYDGLPIDPLQKIKKISKAEWGDTKASEQYNSLTFTYYKASDVNFKNPLPEAPKEIGDYVMFVSAVESNYFNGLYPTNELIDEKFPELVVNPTDSTETKNEKNAKRALLLSKSRIPFSIKKIKLEIDITGSSYYDGQLHTEVFDFINSDILSNITNEKLLTNHRFIGTLVTASKNPGKYYGNGKYVLVKDGPEEDTVYTDYWYWSLNWYVMDQVELTSDLAKYYEIEVIGVYEIKRIEITASNVTSSGVTKVFDGAASSISVTVTGLISDAYPVVYYSTEAITAASSSEKEDPYNTASPWSVINPLYTVPGTYPVYFKVLANNHEPYYGLETVQINPRTISYDIGYTVDLTSQYSGDQDNIPTEIKVPYDGDEHEFVIYNVDPAYALVEYSKDNISWTTVPYKATEPVNQIIYYRITAENYVDIVNSTGVTFNITEDGFHEITPSDYTITSYSGEYDGTGHAISVTITNSDILNAKIYYRLNENEPWLETCPLITNITSVNGQRIYFRIANAVSASDSKRYKNYYMYNNQYVFGTVTITPKEFDATLTGGEYEYDGLYHTVNLTFNEDYTNSGVTVYYSNDQYSQVTGQGWSTDITKYSYKDARDTAYIVYVKISAPNFNDKYASASIKINRSDNVPLYGVGELGVDIPEPVKDDVTGVYEYQNYCWEIGYLARPILDSEIPIQDTPAHDGVRSYTYYKAESVLNPQDNKMYYAKQTDVANKFIKITNPTQRGLYCVRIRFAETNNCFERIIDCYFEITVREITVKYPTGKDFRIEGESYQVEYSGVSQAPNIQLISGTKDEFTPIITLVYPSNVTSFDNVIAIGEYKYTLQIYEDTKGNYKLPDDFVSNYGMPNEAPIPIPFYIVQRTYKLNINDKMEYDGANKTKWHLDETYQNLDKWATGSLLKNHKLELELETSSYVRFTYLYPIDVSLNPQNVINVSTFQIYDEYNNLVADFLNPKDTDLYKLDLTAIVKIHYKEVNFNFPAKKVPYNGDEQYLSLQIDSEQIIDPVISYAEADDTLDPTAEDFYDKLSWSLYSPTFTEVDTYTVYVRVESQSGNFETFYTSATLEIEKINLDIEFDEFDVTYDAESHSIDANVKKTCIIEKVSKNIHPASVKFYPVSEYEFSDIDDIYKDPLLVNSNYYYQKAPNSIKNAGTYYAVAMFLGTGNYNYSYKIQEVTLKQKDLRVSLAQNPRIYAKQYDGVRHYEYLNGATFVTEDLIYGHTIVTGIKLMAHRLATKSANAGMYGAEDFEFASNGLINEGKVDVTQNYHPVITSQVSVVIEQIKLEFTVDEKTTQYYGAEFDGLEMVAKIGKPNVHLPSNLFVDNIPHYLYYAVTVKMENNTPVYEKGEFLGKDNISDVGTYWVVVQYDAGTNFFAYEDYDKYGIVEIKPMKVEINWENLTKEFTGDNLAPTATYVDAFGVEKALNVSLFVYNYSNNSYVTQTYAKKAGKYNALADFSTPQANYELSNDTKKAIFEITPIELTIEVDDVFYTSQDSWVKEVDESDFEGFPSNYYLRWTDTVGKAKLYTEGAISKTYYGKDLKWQYVVFDKGAVITNNTVSPDDDFTQSIKLVAVGKVVVINEGITYEATDLVIPFDGITHSFKEGLKITNPVREGIDYDLLVRRKGDPEFSSKLEDYYSYNVNDYKADGGDVYEFRIVSKIKTSSVAGGFVKITITRAEASGSISGNVGGVYNGQAITPSNLSVTGKFNLTTTNPGNYLIYKYYRCDAGYAILVDPSFPADNPEDHPMCVMYDDTLQSGALPVDRGYYKVVVTSSADLIPDSPTYIKNYGPLRLEKNFEIKEREVRVALDYTHIVAKDSYNNEAYRNLSKTYYIGKNKYVSDNIHLQSEKWVYTGSNLQSGYNLPSDEYLSFTVNTTNNNAIPLGEYNESIVCVFQGDDYINTFGANDFFNLTWNIDNDTRNMKVTGNYKLMFDLNLNIKYPDIPVTVTGVSNASYNEGVVQYGTREYDPDATAGFTIHETYSYGAGETQIVTESIVDMTFEKPSTYTVNYAFAADGYSNTSGTYKIVINYSDRIPLQTPAYLTQKKSYDGIAIGKEQVGTSEDSIIRYGFENLAYDDSYDPNDITISFQQIGLGYKTSTIVNAGTYLFTLTIPASAMYNRTVIEGTFIIEKATIVLTNKESVNPYVFGFNNNPRLYELEHSTSSIATQDKNFDLKLRTGSAPDYNYSDLDPSITVKGTLITSSKNTGMYSSSNTTFGWASGYAIIDSNGVNAARNYEIILDNVSARIDKGAIDATFASVTQTYAQIEDPNNPGQMIHVKYGIMPSLVNPKQDNNTTFMWSTDGVNWQNEKLEYSKPGIYPIYVKINCGENYDEKVLSATLTINKKVPYIELPESLDKVYDGLDPLVPANILSDTDVQKEWWEIYYQQYNPLGITEDEKWLDMGVVRPTAVGKYRVVVDIPEKDSLYFTGNEAHKEFVITERELKVEWGDTAFIYNGKAQQPYASFNTDGMNDELKEVINSLTITYNFEQIQAGDLSNTHAGTYKITANIESNANFIVNEASRTVIYTIARRKVVISTPTSQVTYNKLKYNFYFNEVPNGLSEEAKLNARTFIADKYDLNPNSGLVVDDIDTDFKEGDYFSSLNYITTISGNVNDYESLFYKQGALKGEGIGDFVWTNGPLIYNASSEDVTASYDIYYRMQFRIDFNAIEYEYAKYEGYYDGLEHTFTLEVKNAAEMLIEYNYNDAWTTNKPSYTDVKISEGKVVPYQILFRISDPAGNYSTKTGTAEILIKQKLANLELVKPYKLGKEYDGLSIKNPNVKYVDMDVNPRTVTYKYYKIDENLVETEVSEATIVGNYKLVVTLDSGNNSNYIGGQLVEGFEITKREITIKRTNQYGSIAPLTKTFDYTRLKYDVTNVDVLNLADPSQDQFTGKLQTKLATVGVYTKADDFLWEQAYKIMRGSTDTTSNYTVKYELQFEITQAEIEYTASDINGIVNGQSYAINVEVTKPVNYTVYYYTLADESDKSTKNPKYNKRGVYTVYFEITGSGADQSNFKTVKDERIITIIGNEADYKFIYQTPVTYDGNPYMSNTEKGKPYVEFFGDSIGNNGAQSLNYWKSDGTPLASAPTDAGDYKIRFMVEGTDEFEPITSPILDFKILSAQATVIWGTYDENHNENDVINISTDGTYLVNTFNGEDQKPYAYFVAVNGTKVYLEVNEAYRDANPQDASYDVSVTVPEELSNNYILSPVALSGKYKIMPKKVAKPNIDPNMQFTYSEEYVLLDPDTGQYETYPDTDEYVYRRFGDLIRIYTLNDGEYYVFENDNSEYEAITVFKDENGNILTKDKQKKVPVGIKTDNSEVSLFNEQQLYTLELDVDTNADVKIGNFHYVTVRLIDQHNYEWDVASDYDQADYQIKYTINPFDVDNQTNTNFTVKVIPEANYFIMDLGDYVYPAAKSTVQLIAEDGRTIVKTFVSSTDFGKVLVDNEWKEVEVLVSDQNNSVIYDTDYTNGNDAKRGIVHAKASGNFKFETNGYYEKRATPPASFEIKENSIRRFIKISVGQNNKITKDDGDDLGYVRDNVYTTYPDVYLGRIHQGTLISEIVSEFKNNTENIGVFDNNGNEILSTNWSGRIGSGYEIRLYKTSEHSDENLVDRVTCIIFGDLDGNGLIDSNDFVQMSSFATGKKSYDDDKIGYIAGSIRNNIGPDSNSFVALSSLLGSSKDFNSDYLTVPELLKV